MANGQPDGLGSEAISGAFSSEITHYLLVIVGEPLGQEYVDPSLADVEKALQCWDVDDATIGYDTALQATAAVDINKVGLVHRSLAYCGSKIGVAILINPTSTEVTAELRNLLVHTATNKHLIFGGHWLEGCGDWVLHNDTFTLHDIANIFNEPDVDASVLEASQDERQTLVVSGCHWSTAAVTKQTFTKSLNLTINPQEVKNDVAGVSLVMQTIRNNVHIPSPFELLEPPTMGVGVKCKITKPTVLIFPAGKGDCAFFAVTDFSIFLGGGYCTKSCFWKFAKHLHRIDAIMAPHMQPDSLMGFSSLLKRKIAEQQLTEPEKGSEEYEDWLIKCNSPEVGVVYLNAPENKKSPVGLQLKTVGQGNLTQQLLQELDIKPFSCTANVGKVIEPVTLYQKVGIGRLDMFILTPVHDSKELKDFMLQWSGNKAFSKVKTGMKVNGKESECPGSSAVSICALIVWQPASLHEDIVKVLFPGNATQSKILEGLDRLKHLEYLKYPDVTAARLAKGGAQLKKKPRVASTKTPAKANGPTSVAVNNQAPCNDGIHCNTPPPSDTCPDGLHCNTPPLCADGIHCGTPPPDARDECSDGLHCNTPPPCLDGIHCGTPPPDAQDECSDGIHCNTPPPCTDGIHCGTPPPDARGECPDGLHCNTPPPDNQWNEGGRCPDGVNCNTPPPDEPGYRCHDGNNCGTPPPEDGYNEDVCGNFAPIEPYKCPDGMHCNTPPPDGEVMYADGTHCNTPPPDEDGVMDTQQSPVDNEPQATVGDMCGNLMDSNLPESQQDMGAFTYGGAPDAFNNKPSDTSERLDSGEITPSDQVEYGEESPNVGSFVFDAEAGPKEPATVPAGFGDYAEEDHAAAAPSDGLIGEFEKKRGLSDDSESPTNGTHGISSGAFDDETPSPNGGPHPWEPRIEFSSPEQEPEDNYLVEESRPEADVHDELSAPATFGEIPPPVVCYDPNAEQDMEAQPVQQEYSQDGQFEQKEDVVEEEEEEVSSEASQASEIEVKPDQQVAEEENLMAYEEPIAASQSMPVDNEDINNGEEDVQDEERDDAEMDTKDEGSPEQFEVTSEELPLDQGLKSDVLISTVQDIQEVTEQEVVPDEAEQLLEAEIRGGPIIQIQSSEGQEEGVADDEDEEQEGEIEMGPAGSVESPAPEEDQDQVVPEGEYENQVAPTEESITEAWSQEGLQEINQNFMPSGEFPAAMDNGSLHPEEISPQPEADIEDNRQIQADEVIPLEKSLSYPEADPDVESAERESEDLVQYEVEPSEETPISLEYQAEDRMQDVQEAEGLSDQPEVMQAQPEQAPKVAEEHYFVEAPGIPSTLISEPEMDPDPFSQQLIPEPTPQPEIIAEPVPEYEVEASYKQEVIQEDESLPDQQSSSEPLVDSLSEPLSDKEQDSLSEPQIDQAFEPVAAPEQDDIQKDESLPDHQSTSEPLVDSFSEPQSDKEQYSVSEHQIDQAFEPFAAPEQDVIQEDESLPDQQSLSEPLVDSISEPQSDKEQDSLSESQSDQAFEPVAAPEPEAEHEPVDEMSPPEPILEISPQLSPELQPEPFKEPSSEPSPEPQPEPQPLIAVAAPEPEAEHEPVEMSPPEPIPEISPQPSPELQPEPFKEPSSEPSPEPQPEPQPLIAVEIIDVAKSDVSATQQSVESQPETRPDIVPETAATAAASVSTKTTKTSKTTSTTTKKPGDKATKKDVKSTKSTTKETKSITKTKTSTVADKRSTTKMPSASTKKTEQLGFAKKRTTTAEQKTTADKKALPEKKPLERKSLSERKTTATEKKTNRLSASKPTAGTARSPNRDKSPGKLWERQTAASASRSSSSSNSRTKTNGIGDTKPGPTKKPTPSKVSAKTPPKSGTQRPTGSKAPSSGRKPTESTKRESDRFTRSAPSRTGDAKKSDSSKRPVSAKTSSTTARTQIIPISGPPVYIDLAYVPNHASEDSVNMEFFRRVRSKNYVISANDKGRNQPSMTVMDALLEGRSKWDDPEAEVTVIPTYDIGTLQEWEQKNLQQLSDSKITISQPASRSIVQMKDENFFMYKVEF